MSIVNCNYFESIFCIYLYQYIDRCPTHNDKNKKQNIRNNIIVFALPGTAGVLLYSKLTQTSNLQFVIFLCL